MEIITESEGLSGETELALMPASACPKLCKSSKTNKVIIPPITNAFEKIARLNIKSSVNYFGAVASQFLEPFVFATPLNLIYIKSSGLLLMLNDKPILL